MRILSINYLTALGSLSEQRAAAGLVRESPVWLNEVYFLNPDQAEDLTTLVAWGPLGPSVTSNSTDSPSLRLL